MNVITHVTLSLTGQGKMLFGKETHTLTFETDGTINRFDISDKLKEICPDSLYYSFTFTQQPPESFSVGDIVRLYFPLRDGHIIMTSEISYVDDDEILVSINDKHKCELDSTYKGIKDNIVFNKETLEEKTRRKTKITMLIPSEKEAKEYRETKHLLEMQKMVGDKLQDLVDGGRLKQCYDLDLLNQLDNLISEI